MDTMQTNCPACGAAAADASAFCGECGARLHADSAPPATAPRPMPQPCIAVAQPAASPWEQPNSLRNLWTAYAITALIGAGLVCLACLAPTPDSEAAAIGVGLAFCVGCLPTAASVVLQALLLYRLWYSIQDGRCRTTPGKAVGYMFIPLFNLYWVFTAVRGLALDMNRVMRERQIKHPEIPEGLALACAILYCGVPAAYVIDSNSAVLFGLTGMAYAIVSAILFKRLADATTGIMSARTSVSAAS